MSELLDFYKGKKVLVTGHTGLKVLGYVESWYKPGQM